MNTYIKRLGPNFQGRDFVCGDIHGSFSCVEKFLEEIKFQPEDRLICTGDLIDRGPDNEKCLDLLYEPWFHSVKGNHEVLMEDYFEGGRAGEWWIPNGGAWGMQYDTDPSDQAMHIRDTVKEKVAALPYLLTVEKKDGGIFHVLHAELYCKPDAIITDETLADWDKLQEHALIQDRNGEVIIWGRFIFGQMYGQILDQHAVAKIRRGVSMNKSNHMFNPALSHIYSGHTIVKQPLQFYGQTNLDTMAYGSYDRNAPDWRGLTVTEPATGKFWLVNDREFKEVLPVVIADESNIPS